MRHLAPHLRDRFDYRLAGFFLVAWILLAGASGAVTGTLIARGSAAWLIVLAVTVMDILYAVGFAQRRADYREENA